MSDLDRVRENLEILADCMMAPAVCPECRGEGEITVPGFSVNPSAGTLVRDPQEAREVRCPACRGTGDKPCTR